MKLEQMSWLSHTITKQAWMIIHATHISSNLLITKIQTNLWPSWILLSVKQDMRDTNAEPS